jgi:hypothetical protein
MKNDISPTLTNCLCQTKQVINDWKDDEEIFYDDELLQLIIQIQKNNIDFDEINDATNDTIINNKTNIQNLDK